jgi:hypothetical protein
LTYEWISSGIEEIILFTKGNTDTGYFSYATDRGKYSIPTSIFAILFGKGHITMGMESTSGISSDVGYTNDIWFGGVFYLLIVYLFFVKMMWRLIKSNDGIISFIGIFLLILYPIINIKGIIFSMNSLTNFFILLFVVLIRSSKSYK